MCADGWLIVAAFSLALATWFVGSTSILPLADAVAPCPGRGHQVLRAEGAQRPRLPQKHPARQSAPRQRRAPHARRRARATPPPGSQHDLAANVCLRLSADPGAAPPGAIVQYSLVAENHGLRATSSLRATVPLPPHFRLCWRSIQAHQRAG